MAATYDELVSERRFHEVTYTMVVLASLFTIARGGIQIWKRKAMQLQDYLIYAAYLFFLIMSVCYLVIIPKIYMIGRVTNGSMAPWATMAADVVMYIRVMFVTTMFFWMSLWLVKLSLLALYKKLMTGLPMIYVRLWWAVFIFCLISLAGCMVSYLTSCPDFAASMRTGECSGPRSLRGQLASLYTSYTVDILSDFMIMLLPIRLVWNLQVPRGQKIAIIALFASGFICIAFATLRVVQIGRQTGDTNTPNPTWLALWTIIETSIAICIGCCPAFAVLYRTARTSRVSYDTHGYYRHTQSRSGGSQLRPDIIRMNTVNVGAVRSRMSRKDPYWDDTRSSQEALAADNKGIMVTTTLHQDHEHSDAHTMPVSARVSQQ
ncbi:hypothetical protein BU25DRAFT_478056 [Macroventuria anomochaeta]|uniref:Uncharacterized protein n=1 Tax=Macroventuria anomochaeta TaxID=301207 RepID=A0ACB6RNP9_9PLEO|nr:uncharacterized protein BU25DRAFT_478056 [Macroventuria anomochaeta]KAF2623580.1 hypothetical protein BU25DRAFT_478056 [Macroventuria anomochaeta]